MKRLITLKQFFSRYFVNRKPNLLGRWNITYCRNSLNRKVDLSNEDHCGPCGQYTASKLKEKNDNNKK